MIETSINVKLDRFDGPLGLLLHLIQKEEMNIRELDITQITNQYLDYLQKLKDINFDIAGEYLYMAATLLYIKSKASVVEGEDGKQKLESDEDFPITTKTQLIQKLEELQRFQELGQRLWTLPRRGEDIFVRPKVDKKSIQNSILTPMELDSLTDVMVDLIRKEKRKYTVVKRDRLSIKEKLISLKNKLAAGTHTTMDTLIDLEKGRNDIVITFISLLELARLKRLEIFQNENYGSIYVNVKDSLESFDVETADGFEPEEEVQSIQDSDIVASPEGESLPPIPVDSLNDEVTLQ
jgi:segregation and condensation protein A